MELSCPTCFRVERRQGGAVEVVTAGGQRVPALHPEVARYRTLVAALAGGLPPAVDHCPCGQLLVGDGPFMDVDLPELGVSLRDRAWSGDVANLPRRLRALAPEPWWKPRREAFMLPVLALVLVGPTFLLTFGASFIWAYLTYWWHSWVPDFIGY